MLKKILAVCAMLFAVATWAATTPVDVNKATAAELDSVKGIGPKASGRILDARKQGDFKDWPDFMSRVKGVKEKAATKLSAQGLTVNGKSYDGAMAPTSAKPGKTSAMTKSDSTTAMAPKTKATP